MDEIKRLEDFLIEVEAMRSYPNLTQLQETLTTHDKGALQPAEPSLRKVALQLY